MKSHQLTQWVAHILFIAVTIGCLFPFLLLIMTSITDENTLLQKGYSIFPSKISLDAYAYLWRDSSAIVRAYAITIFVTLVGTVAGLLITALLAYPLSRKDMPARNPLAFIVFFTMLFNGGLVPTYLVYTQLFDMKNTLLALILPGLLTNGFFILLMRTFFGTSIPTPIIESASMDGAGEFRIFYRIILPLSLPILATVGLMQTIMYWNDWYNGLIYITDSKLFSLQNLLNRILMNAQFLQSNSVGNQNVGTSIPTETVRMAMAVIGVVPLLCAYPFFQKYFVKGLVIGAIKG
ncbi:carbohydrate ABC transporter permease [Paenibacillus guangzhouensis]|uniref:carbohydrate ABC transporter permease n=1 Tax=Paenibacillus guangzhouensis TaxID=1473112 RepID=UPI0012672015|nr:carbohydrate ABC transporter permease [Paenibacillus guangzhouensis]